MGSGIAPKTFIRSGPQGASDATNPVTQAQPQTQLPNQLMPDFTAYGMQQATPGTPNPNSPNLGGAGSLQDFREARRNMQKPFFGQMF